MTIHIIKIIPLSYHFCLYIFLSTAAQNALPTRRATKPDFTVTFGDGVLQQSKICHSERSEENNYFSLESSSNQSGVKRTLQSKISPCLLALQTPDQLSHSCKRRTERTTESILYSHEPSTYSNVFIKSGILS